jgi:hypothetical protein
MPFSVHEKCGENLSQFREDIHISNKTEHILKDKKATPGQMVTK